jgi:hypothetical protein
VTALRSFLRYLLHLVAAGEHFPIAQLFPSHEDSTSDRILGSRYILLGRIAVGVNERCSSGSVVIWRTTELSRARPTPKSRLRLNTA